MDLDWVDVFPIKNGDIPASYVSLPEGKTWMNLCAFAKKQVRIYGGQMA